MAEEKEAVVQVKLTAASYELWLRAGKPQPIQWFLNITELEQQALAILGDRYTHDIWEGLAVRLTGEPEEEPDPETEEEHVRRLAMQGIQNVFGERAQPVAPSMMGITERKAAAVKQRQDAEDKKRSLMGRLPDAVRKKQEEAG